MDDVALGMKSASRAMNACMYHLRCLRVEILQVSKWRCMVSYCVCMYVCIHSIAYFLYLFVCIMHECIHVSMHSFLQLHTIDMLLYVCLSVCMQGNCGSGSSPCFGRHCHHLLLRQYLHRSSRGSSPKSFLPLRKDPSSTRE